MLNMHALYPCTSSFLAKRNREISPPYQGIRFPCMRESNPKQGSEFMRLGSSFGANLSRTTCPGPTDICIFYIWIWRPNLKNHFGSNQGCSPFCPSHDLNGGSATGNSREWTTEAKYRAVRRPRAAIHLNVGLPKTIHRSIICLRVSGYGDTPNSIPRASVRPFHGECFRDRFSSHTPIQGKSAVSHA